MTRPDMTDRQRFALEHVVTDPRNVLDPRYKRTHRAGGLLIMTILSIDR